VIKLRGMIQARYVARVLEHTPGDRRDWCGFQKVSMIFTRARSRFGRSILQMWVRDMSLDFRTSRSRAAYKLRLARSRWRTEHRHGYIIFFPNSRLGIHIQVCIVYIYIYIYIYIWCPRRNVPDFVRVFLMLNYTDITQNTYIQSWTVTEIMAREVWNFDSYYSLIDYKIHIETGRNMWFL